MVNHTAARRPHLWSLAYAFGLLALLGTATTLVVLVREPALSSTRPTTPVPAPEITVVDDDPLTDTGTDPFAESFALGEPDGFGAGDDPSALPGAGGGSPGATGPDGVAHGAPHSAEDVRRSLFWSGVFGLAISLAGLGLVGTRRRMW